MLQVQFLVEFLELFERQEAMAQQFVGMTVALTLSNNAQLKGTVSKVDSTTQILHLLDGIYIPPPNSTSKKKYQRLS